MPQPAPGTELLRTLAAAALRDGRPAALAERAAAALAGVFQGPKSFVLDVQFTGFAFKGKPLGGADPELLRAAGRLIVLRLARLGFTPEASAGDLRVLFEALAEPGPGGVVARVAEAQPRGVYLAASTGEVYRPPRRPRPPPPSDEPRGDSVDGPGGAPAGEERPAAAGETSAPRGGGGAAAPGVYDPFGDDETDLRDFELLDDFPAIAPAALRAVAGAPVEVRDGGDGPANDMFNFFRTASADLDDDEVDGLPRLLHDVQNPTRFDELSEAATRAIRRLIRSERHGQAVELLEALVREAERPDRTRTFRESAGQALRRVGTPQTLQQLQGFLELGGEARERILHFFAFMGGEAAEMLEALLFRTGDPALRVAVFRHLARVDGAAARIAARSLSDGSPARARLMLELAALPEVAPDVAARWLGDAAAHADAGVRADAARVAGAVGGRGGLRVLLDLLGDREPVVKRAAAQALGTLGDPAAVPFLARVVADGGDEEAQVSAIGALGRLRSAEALPALLGVINKRGGLFSARKLSRPKSAAIAAIAQIPTPAAREVIHSLAGGKDAEVAAEAQRVLATMD